MNQLQVFNFDGNEVRTVLIDGEVWFVGKDIGGVLGYSNTRDAITRHVDELDQIILTSQNTTLENMPNRGMVGVNESGVYALIFGSKLPEAIEVKRWVTSKVLPTIRKHGAYMTTEVIEKTLTNPDFIIGLATELKNLQEQNRSLEDKNKEMTPKALFFDQVASSKDAVEMGKVAKVLNIPGFGRNKLFEFLRNNGVLMKNNLPYQRYCDSRHFRVIETKYTTPEGEVKVSFKTLVYQKGLDYIRKLVEQEKVRK